MDDKSYQKHLHRAFQKHILKQFGRNAQLRQIFNAIDLAGNGVLDANEIRMVLRSAGEPEEVITKIVSSLSFKRHGGKVEGVTFDEFQTIMKEY